MNMAVDQLSSEWSNVQNPVTHSVAYRPSCDNREVLQLCRIGLKKVEYILLAEKNERKSRVRDRLSS